MDYRSGEAPAIKQNEQRKVKATRTKNRAGALIDSPDPATRIRDWKSNHDYD
jgi:hypothetical protein